MSAARCDTLSLLMSANDSGQDRSQGSAVIAAFPATGKTHVACRDHRFVDSDSSSFSWSEPGVRNPDWPENYIAHIENLIADGRTTVLCSTHQEVRDALVAAGLPFTLVYPPVSARDSYVARMRLRGSTARLVDFIGDRWDDLIESCQSQQGCEHIVLSGDRHLSDVLRRRHA